MRTFEISTPIHYPVDLVWPTLINLEQWRRWNSVVPSASGIIEPGKRLDLRMKGPGGRLMPLRPVVTTVKPHAELALAAVVFHRVLLYMHHRFLLKPTSPTETELVQRWECSGLLVSLMWERVSEGMRPFAAFGADLEQAIVA